MQATNQGVIEAVKQSKSGKTLGVLMKDAHGNEQWHSTKHFELQAKQGAEIQYNASTQNMDGGGVLHWLNDYQEIGTGGTTADAAFNAAHAQEPTGPPMGSPTPPQMAPQAPQNAPAPQSSGINKDAYIAAQALAKTVTHATAADALNAFQWLYRELRDWNPDAEFDDNINF